MNNQMDDGLFPNIFSIKTKTTSEYSDTMKEPKHKPSNKQTEDSLDTDNLSLMETPSKSKS